MDAVFSVPSYRGMPTVTSGIQINNNMFINKIAATEQVETQ